MRHQNLLAPIPSRDSLEFLARVIRFQSYSGTPGESELAHFMIDPMTGRGSRRSSSPSSPSRPTGSTPRWRGTGGGESILFNGHLGPEG